MNPTQFPVLPENACNPNLVEQNLIQRLLDEQKITNHLLHRNNYLLESIKETLSATTQVAPVLPNSYVPSRYVQRATSSELKRRSKPKPEKVVHHPTGSKRPILIDGANVAYTYGTQVSGGRPLFSWKGIGIAVDYFQCKGHDQIKVILSEKCVIVVNKFGI